MSRDYDPNHIHKREYFKVGVKVIVFNKDDKFILLQRSQKSGKGGSWSLPGGALEYGEDAHKAVKREIEEETLLKVKDINVFSVITHSDPKDPLVILGFKCNYESGDVTLNWEHDDYKWVSKKEALEYDLTPDAQSLVTTLQTG